MKKLIVSLLIGFILGVLASWGGMKFFPRKWSPEAHHQHMLKMFSSKLDLTKDQQEKVSAILDETRKKIEELRSETKPRFEEVRKETRGKIRAVLNPEQQKKYDLLDAEMTNRWQKHKRP